MSDATVITFSRTDRAFAIAWGVMLTLCITGYTFGQSNHHVYLLDALRIQEPDALARDWFTNNTLQYHFLFTRLVLALKQIHLLETGFFMLYVGLAVALHAAWLSIVRHVGGGLRTYLFSTLLYHLSAGGLGLGVYQFLQDGSFLPSNISAIATLAAIAFWLDRRLWMTSVCVGIAGLFHVNYAVALVGFWGFLSVVTLSQSRPFDRRAISRYIGATLIAMSPCLFNVTNAAIGALSQESRVPLAEFVEVYVKLRHEHHHDPLRWPLALWISFLWPLPLAFLAMPELPASAAIRRLNLVFILVLAMELFAFVFAGIWFVSDTIVQLSLFRFSIVAKLISCTYAASYLARRTSPRVQMIALATIAALLLVIVPLRDQLPRSIPQPHLGLLLGAATMSILLAVWIAGPRGRKPFRIAVAIALPVVLFFASRQQLGVAMPGENDPDMRELAAWARTSTPPRSLFLTPPHDAIFGLAARRSSVVGFKQVPQLSGELIEWKRRLDLVLDGDIKSLPRPMPSTLEAMAKRYASLSGEHLQSVAQSFDCDFLITMRPLENIEPAHVTPDRRYFVYRIARIRRQDG